MVKLIPMSMGAGFQFQPVVVVPPVTPFPGQPGNLVGFANTPAAQPARWTAGAWPGAYPGSLTPASGAPSSGTPSSPNIVAFKNYQLGTSPLSITGHDITFVGCEFGFSTPNNSSAATGVQVNTGGYNIQFVYCSFVPLDSFGYAAPPGAAWPSAGAEQNTVTQVTDVNCVDGSKGYQFAIGAYSSTVNGSFMLQCDHCDFWAMGNGALDTLTTTNQINFYDCWIHDCCNASPVGFHQDGVGYLDGSGAPANVLIQHCTIASIGNTNAIAWQTTTTTYQNIEVINNYLSGYSTTIDMCHNITGSTGLVFTDNIIGTDLQVIFAWARSIAPLYTSTGNLWRRNTINVVPATTANSGFVPSWSSANQGYFLWPDNSINATDWPN